MMVYINFEKDLEEIVAAMFLRSGGRRNQALRPFRQFAQLFDHADRQVPDKRYTVHVSSELQKKSNWFPPKGPLREVITRLEQGQTIRPFLSKEVALLGCRDRLLRHWRINHMHLKAMSTIDKQGFVERSGDLLFFRVERDCVYLIDILQHPPCGSTIEWSNSELVKIVDRNWPHLQHLFSNSSPQENVLDDAMYASLRSNNVNAMVSTARGSVFVGGGTMATGESFRAHTEWMLLLRHLARVQDYVAHKYSKIFGDVGAYASAVRLDEIHNTGCTIFDGASQRHAFIKDAEVNSWFEIPFPSMKLKRGVFITHHSA